MHKILFISTMLGVAMPSAFDAQPVDPVVTPEIRAGWLLFYDPVISGNQNISCATCHHPKFGTSDGVSLSLGEGATGLGPDRVVGQTNPPEQRIPRNAPSLFNLGEAEFSSMFHDGRLESDPTKPAGIRTPLGEDMTLGFDSVLSAQAMFPVLSGDEMAGQYSENDVSELTRLGQLSQPGGAWEVIAARVNAIPEYRTMFDDIIGPDQPVHFTDISNVVADFIIFEWRADNSRFDQYMRGTADLTQPELFGMTLFYGKAECGTCHLGRFQTDQDFHAIAMPQLGPGKAARFEGHHRDEGRLRVTGRAEDLFRFRTPSLRNITETAPYGHSGAYATLDGVIRHHLDPIGSLLSYDRSQAVLADLPGAEDWTIMDDPAEVAAIADANELAPLALTDGEIDAITAFLHTLTDAESVAGRLGVPDKVPSGLAVDK